MLNRRKFLRNGILFSIGSLLFPNYIYSEESVNESFLEHKPEPENWKESQINISWIGHSTILINYFGTVILTDPALLDRVGIYIAGTSFGPARLTPPALNIDEIPRPDIVLLSHAHMDHMDYPTLKKLTKKYPNQIDAITAHLTKDVINDLKWKSLSSLDWGDQFTLHDIKFTALEVKHFGWRFPWEKDRSRGYFEDGRSYNAYLLEKNGRGILFGGDTTMTDKLKVLADKKIDVALMPVGAYNPWKRAHCNPEEALQMAESVNAKYFIPMHCKTFQQGSEPFEEPIDWLKKSVKNYKIELGLDTIGQTFTIS